MSRFPPTVIVSFRWFVGTTVVFLVVRCINKFEREIPYFPILSLTFQDTSLLEKDFPLVLRYFRDPIFRKIFQSFLRQSIEDSLKKPSTEEREIDSTNDFNSFWRVFPCSHNSILYRSLFYFLLFFSPSVSRQRYNRCRYWHSSFEYLFDVISRCFHDTNTNFSQGNARIIVER